MTEPAAVLIKAPRSSFMEDQGVTLEAPNSRDFSSDEEDSEGGQPSNIVDEEEMQRVSKVIGETDRTNEKIKKSSESAQNLHRKMGQDIMKSRMILG